jgi:YaiO family outer membrane protein
MNRTQPTASALRTVLVILLAMVGTSSDIDAQDTLSTRIGLSYQNSSFTGEGALKPWHELSVQLARSTELGTVFGRVNLADRFGRRATQVELDAYPRLGEGRYAFVNLGVGDDALYPTLRGSLEVWQGLPGSFEGSLGLRYLRFSRDVVLYTGSLAFYTGNNWISARPWVRSRDGEFSVSTHLSVRKYGRDNQDFLGFVVGVGSGIGDLDTKDELDRLRSYRVGLEARKPVSDTWRLKAGTSVEWEELVRDRTRNRFKFSLGIERSF